jgi:hypothetical protein
MMFSVPQFIDVEDKIAGPLTWRQLLWMIGMGVTLLIIYNMAGTIGFLVIAVPVILLFSALAFYRPHGQPLVTFMAHGVMYFFRPKVAVWERPVGRLRTLPQEDTSKKVQPTTEKRISPEELKRLATLVDRRSS